MSRSVPAVLSGAGIPGAGIGGPLADAFNARRPGPGYQVIFALCGVLFLISALVFLQVKARPKQDSL